VSENSVSVLDDSGTLSKGSSSRVGRFEKADHYLWQGEASHCVARVKDALRESSLCLGFGCVACHNARFQLAPFLGRMAEVFFLSAAFVAELILSSINILAW
jgi:hypothetical protein